jgi:hypothetical protein
MAGWIFVVIGLALVVLNKPLSALQNAIVFGSADDANRLRGTRVAVIVTGAFFAAFGALLLILR